jgi:hypothetical protein
MSISKQRLTYSDVVALLPTLKREEQLQLFEMLSSALKSKGEQPGRKHSLLELEGLGADSWSKVDIEKYVSSERDSWS